MRTVECFVFPVYVDCSNSVSYGVGYSKYAAFEKTANVGRKNAGFWNREEVSSVCCLYRNESLQECSLFWFGFIDLCFFVTVLFSAFPSVTERLFYIFNLLNIWWCTDFVVSSLRDRQPFVILSMFGFCLNAIFSFSFIL